MKQQADKEMVAIRRITETLQALEPSGRARVLDYVRSRIADMPAEQTQPAPAPRLPFPDAARVRAAVNGGDAKLQARDEAQPNATGFLFGEGPLSGGQ